MTSTHYIRANGNDQADGLTPRTAWRTINKAVAALWNVPGPVVQVGPGYFVGQETPSGEAGRYRHPITWLAEYPCIDKYRNTINVGLHTVIEGSLRCGPVGNGVVTEAPWTQVTLNGHTVWKWSGVGTAPRYSLGYGVTRDATPKRVTYWKRDTLRLATPEGWAELVATNRTQRHGYYQSAAGDLYLVHPNIADPNELWWTAGVGAGFASSSPDCRWSGFVIRGFDVGVQPGAYADRFVVDSCRIETCNNGVKVYPAYPSHYPKDVKVRHNLLVNTGLWSDDQQADPSAVWIMAKGKIKLADGTRYPTTRISHPLEGMGIYVTACSRADISHNTIEGYTNGIGSAPHADFDLGASKDVDVHDNVIRRIQDDAIEFEQQAINLRIYRNVVEDSSTFMSTGPTHRGPIHVWHNRARIGMRGLARDLDGIVDGAASVVFKYSKASNPQAHVYVTGNTFVDDGESVVVGGAQYTAGSGTPEYFHLANNLFRMSLDGWHYWPGHFEEHHNQFVTPDPARGMKNLRTQVVHANFAAYRADSGQGEGSCPVDLHDCVSCDALLDDDLRPTPAGLLALPGVACPGILGSIAMRSPS